MTDSKDALRILKVDPNYAFGEQDGCMLVVWRGQPTEEAYRERGGFMSDLVARLPGRCGSIDVIETSSKPPSPAARKVVAEAMKEVGKSLSCVGMVIEGNELRSTLVRAVLTGMMLLVRSDQPMRVDKDLLRSATWVCGKMQATEPTLPARLVEAIERLRASIPRG